MVNPRASARSTTYVATAVLLAAHEVDAGFWREWDLFGLPGGAGLFVLLHLGIFFLLFWGYGQVLVGGRNAVWMSLVLSLGALGAGAVHGAFLWLGRPEFRDPVSIGVLAALALGGALLAIECVRLGTASPAPPAAGTPGGRH
jgi:hypothetical protein